MKNFLAIVLLCFCELVFASAIVTLKGKLIKEKGDQILFQTSNANYAFLKKKKRDKRPRSFGVRGKVEKDDDNMASNGAIQEIIRDGNSYIFRSDLRFFLTKKDIGNRPEVK